MSELRRVLADNRLVARPRYHRPPNPTKPTNSVGASPSNRTLQPARSTVMLTAKSIKATVVLDAAALLDIVANGSGPVPFVIAVGDQSVKGQFNAKTLRRAVTAVREAGAENVAVVVHGRLVGNRLEEAGIVAQPRSKPAAAPAQQ
jgi:hypothetical protein